LEQLGGAFPNYPTPIAELIKRSKNLLGMTLSPEHPDQLLRLPDASFRLKRRGESTSGGALFRQLLRQHIESNPPVNPLTAFVFATESLHMSDYPDEPKYSIMQDRIRMFMNECGEPLPPFSFNTLQQFTSVLMMDFENMGELLESAIQAESISASSASHFHSSSNAENLCMMMQMFVGLVSLHLRAYKNEPQDLGEVCENNAGNMVSQLVSALQFPSPEDGILDCLQQWFNRDLTDELRVAVKERFQFMWMTVKDSPHLDEFLVLLKDVPGDGVSYRGCICMPFVCVFNTLLENKVVQVDEGEHGDVLRDALLKFECAFREAQDFWRTESFPHSNEEMVESQPIEVEESELLEYANRATVQQVAELLLAQEEEDEMPLYRRFWNHMNFKVSNWNHLRLQLLSMMQDQAALDAFSCWEQQFNHSLHVWVRITAYIARSLYTHATATIPGALGQLVDLSNQERPDKLYCALELLSIQVPLDCIHMNEYYDGYTVMVTEAQKERILEIHKLRRQNFHVTKAMAMAVYQQVERRYGSHSTESTTMNSLTNAVMRPIPGYHFCAPPKIFEAMRLLDIVIGQWEFNGFDGYIVSGDAGTIDLLERTVECSEYAQQSTRTSNPQRGTTLTAPSRRRQV